MPRLAVLLCAVMLATSSHAATRVFYDGSEAGNTDLWSQDGYRNKCTSVTSAADGVTGPYAGSRMIRCNDNGSVAWNTAEAYETLAINSFPYTTEFLFRIRFRPDQNHDKSGGSSKKLYRFYSGNVDYFSTLLSGVNGLKNEGPITSGSYWGYAPGDNSASSSKWSKVEIYYNSSTRNLKQWNDGILVRNDTLGSLNNWYPFYLTSNFADSHDAVNYSYFDEIEIYSDSSSGTPATGSMNDATITVSGSSSNPSTLLPNPQDLRIVP